MRDKSINDALNISHYDPEDDNIDKTYDLVPYESIKDNEVMNDECAINDIQYARDNIKELIDISKDAMNELSTIAKQSQHPRAFEVLNAMIKNMADINKDLIEVHNKKQEVLNTTKTKKDPQVVNNTLFVGSTAELLNMINKQNTVDD